MKLDLDKDYYMNLWLDTYQEFSFFGKKEKLTTEQINLCKRCINFLDKSEERISRSRTTEQRINIMIDVFNSPDLIKLMGSGLSISEHLKKIKYKLDTKLDKWEFWVTEIENEGDISLFACTRKQALTFIGYFSKPIKKLLEKHNQQ